MLPVLVDTHTHTTYSDGQDSLHAMVEAANTLGLQTLAITDHVRATTDWFDGYLRDVKALGREYRGKLRLLAGFEAKVVNLDGDLDAREEFFNGAELVIGSFHGIPTERGLIRAQDLPQLKEEAQSSWLCALGALLKNPRVHVLGHLGSEFAALGAEFPERVLQEVAERVEQSGKVVEVNAKYQAPPPALLQRLVALGVPLTFASDSHSVQDLCARHADQGNFLSGVLGASLPRARWSSFGEALSG